MKQKLLFLLVLFFACTGSLYAQVLKKAPLSHDAPAKVSRGTIEAGSNQMWWGYMGSATEVSSIGIGVADTYHCAFYLPGDHDVAGGKKICAVRFGLLAQNTSDVMVWIADKLPSGTPTSSNTLWMATVPRTEIGEWNDVALDTPLAIPAEGVYVGYSFAVLAAASRNDQYPILVAGYDAPNGMLLRTENNISQWADFYGEGYGVLAMKVLLEGEFAQNSITPSMPVKQYYAQAGETADVDVFMTNSGQADVNSFSYTVTTDGVSSEEKTVTLTQPLTSLSQGYMTLTVDANTVESDDVKTVTITKVNGVPNESNKPSVDFTLFTLAHFIPRNVVVEEFTGTGCGYCPRGLVGMEKLRNTFGDRFIGIGIHQYNESDAMYINNYAYIRWEGAPSCMIDRGEFMDPYYGTDNDICDDFRAEMNKPAMLEVDVTGTVNDMQTEVTATASIKPLFDTSNYTLEFVVIGDGLSGTTSAWSQSNYYASNGSSQIKEEDLKIFGSGGKYGQSSIRGYVFNDVALSYAGGSQVESLGTMIGGQTHQVTQKMSLPTKATLRNAIKKGTLYVVALVVDEKGRIANAAKREIGDPSGVTAVLSDNADAVSHYSLNGVKLSAPQRGINIVRMGNGEVRKVLVK